MYLHVGTSVKRRPTRLAKSTCILNISPTNNATKGAKDLMVLTEHKSSTAAVIQHLPPGLVLQHGLFFFNRIRVACWTNDP